MLAACVGGGHAVACPVTHSRGPLRGDAQVIPDLRQVVERAGQQQRVPAGGEDLHRAVGVEIDEPTLVLGRHQGVVPRGEQPGRSTRGAARGIGARCRPA